MRRVAPALVPWPRMRSNTASPSSSQTMASPSMTQERMGSTSIASATSGNRSVRSWPLRVTSRILRPRRCARIRKPSCLIP